MLLRRTWETSVDSEGLQHWEGSEVLPVEKVFLSFCCVWKDIRDPLCQMDCEDFCVDEFLGAAMLRRILRDCCVGKDSEGLQFGEGF